MRLIDADKLRIDCMTNRGKVAVSQSQLANATTYELNELLDKVAEIFPKSFCTYCNQEACEGGMVGTIQECETIRMIKDVINGVIEDMKGEVE